MFNFTIRGVISLTLLLFVSFITPLQIFAACPPSPTDMTSWWKGDGNALDSSGNGNNGTLGGGTTFATGQINQAFSFDGVNDRITVPDSSSVNFTTGDFTIMTWVKTSSAIIQTVFQKGTHTGSLPGYLVAISSSGAVRTVIRNTSLVDCDRSTTRVISDGNWHLIGVQRQGSTLRLFIDGQEDTNSPQSSCITGSISSTGESLSIGNWSPSNVEQFNGLIDDARFFDRAITSQEVQNIYEEGTSAYCGPATSRKDTLVREQISELANHTIEYTVAGGVAVSETMTITFPTGFSIPGSLDFTDVDVSYGPTTGLENNLTLAATPSGATWGASLSGQVLTITSGTGTIPSTSRVVIEVGTHATTGTTGDQRITNPGSAGSYTMSIGGTFNENGDIAIPITQSDQVIPTAVVSPSITFDIDAATTDSDTGGTNTVAFGTLSVGTLSTARTDSTGTINALFFDLSTNAVSGAIVTMQGANTGLSSIATSTTITLPSNEATIIAGQERMGACISSLAVSSGGPLLASANYDADGTSNCTSTNGGTPTVGKIQTTASTLFTSTGAPVSAGRAALLLKASVTAITPAASDYTNTLTFIAVGTF